MRAHPSKRRFILSSRSLIEAFQHADLCSCELCKEFSGLIQRLDMVSVNNLFKEGYERAFFFMPQRFEKDGLQSTVLWGNA